MTIQVIRPYVLRQVLSETPIGTKNGVNMIFQTEFPFLVDGVSVYLNGLKLLPGSGNDYTINVNAKEIIFQSYAPISTDIILVDYIRSIYT